ncbi:MAG: hypothetical protein HC905_04880 [Bacteroidales bacterium]|nr:hypothetical protein [Bacteroidales bacterium]
MVSGVNIASDAGVMIAEILKSISLIAQMLKDITEEAQEQAKIIDSNLEITNLNTLAAEKLSASASSLDKQANQLLDIVKHFNLS